MTTGDTPIPAPRREQFPTTQWSLVARAGEADDPAARREALESLCRDYWYPLYAFVRRKGVGPDDAADRVQGFLAELIERGRLAAADPGRGRFRAFLLASITNHLGHARERESAAKRGGGRAILPIDAPGAEGRYAREPSHELTAERLFERRWALEVLETVLGHLEREAIAAGQGERFARLRPWLEATDADSAAYREAAESLGMTPGALRVAVHRLRARYRALLRDEIARTLADPDDMEDELGSLLGARYF